MHPRTIFNDPRRLIRLIASLFVASLAALVLFGWTVGSSLLTRLHPDLPVMVPNTAACLLLMAGVLVLCGLERPTLRCRIATGTAGGLTFLVGSLTFAEYLFDAGLGIDGLLLHFAQSVVYETNPGRMAPHTALAMMTAGPAIAFLCRKKRLGQISEIFAILTLAIAFSALLGHLFGAQALQGLSKTNGMALHSAISLMVLSAGMLVANPRSLIIALFFSKTLGGAAARRLLPVAVLVPTVIGFVEVRGTNWGWYNVGFGTAGGTLLTTALLVGFIVYFARMVHRADLSRRSAEHALTEKEELYRTLVDHGMGLICTHDTEGRVISVNPAALRTLGFKQDEITGRSISKMLEPELRPHFDAYLREINNAGIAEGYIRLRTREGKPITFRYHNILITDGRTGKYVLGHAQDVTELLEAQAKLRTLSLTDELTKLYNRRGFLELANQQLRLESHSGTARGLTLMFADMDGLKAINDIYGHEAGSEAIAALAQILKAAVRGADIVARWGGDEFVILAIGSPGENSAKLVERIEAAIDDFNRTSDKPYTLACSIGVSAVDVTSPEAFEAFLHEADLRMYEEKKRKKGVLALAGITPEGSAIHLSHR